MGVILEKVKAKAIKTAEKGADTLAKLSKLSPGQIADLQEKRDYYLNEKTSLGDEAAKEHTSRLMAATSVEVFNSYLNQIKDLYVPEELLEEEKFNEQNSERIKYFDITRWVTDKKENSLEKLVNVYQVLDNEDCNIALVFQRTKEKCYVYLGVRNNSENSDKNIALNYSKRLKAAIKGNFPGSQIGKKEKEGSLDLLQNINGLSVATISNIPSEKSEKFISQTIEKLFDGIVPENNEDNYTVVLLATPVHDIESRKTRLGELYSAFVPYSSWQTGYTFTESDSTSSNANFGVNLGVNAGSQQSQSFSHSEQEFSSKTVGFNASTNISIFKKIINVGVSVAGTVGKALTNTLSVASGSSFGINAGMNFARSSSITATVGKNETITQSFSNYNIKHMLEILEKQMKRMDVSAALGMWDFAAYVLSKDYDITNNVAHMYEALTQGEESFMSHASINIWKGDNPKEADSKIIKEINTLKKDKENIITNFSDLSNKQEELQNTILDLENKKKVLSEEKESLENKDEKSKVKKETKDKLNELNKNLQGIDKKLNKSKEAFNKNSTVIEEEINKLQEKVNAINEKLQILKPYQNSLQAEEIIKYIRSFEHPVFSLNQELIELDPSFLVYPLRVTPTTTLTGKELAYSLNFPAKSVSGFPVLECASFGRSISTYDLPEETKTEETKKLFDLGKIYHMNNEESLSVQLNPDLLTSHVFITGSTGSGKSNTVYQLLKEAKSKDKKFLVIEPAKGEYKNVFGGEEDVTVYGTNPKISKLLKINPFSFPDNVHVLEHMDRLVEIFNVCWPMYAAMPAVLKEAIEKSYEDAGWDLIKSDGKEYPTFADVAQNIKIIIDTSEYDAENKGAYKGSLLTRLKSLTNGLNGLIFSSDEIPASDLFDKNVIIDLSRVGSQETKSFLMGILVLKLQEYRMSSGTGMNAGLKHITVLEEAHNLLKRTSTEQSAESSNLAGKSVEMLTNAIAEMRTYGEAFFIVDQAPALLDMAVIRNTNTKIIMRLPDLGDRELVGKAANLNDDQITELAKLPTGVAAVYQNQWVEAVLCKVKEFENISKNNAYKDKPETNVNNDKELDKKRIHIAGLLSKGEKLPSSKVADAAEELKSLNISYAVKAIAIEYLTNPPSEPKMTKLAPVMAALFPKAYEATKRTYSLNQDNPALWTNDIINALNRQYLIDKENLDLQLQRDVVQALVTQYVFNEIHQVAKLEEWTKHHGF